MASGETLIAWNAWDGYPPSANFATQDFRNGHPVMDFDDTTEGAAADGGGAATV